MEYSFPRYLLSKQSVDDRALNRQVYEMLLARMLSLSKQRPIRIIEVGAGIGTMLARLLRWGLLQTAEYVAVDELAENIEYALGWIPHWATAAGLRVERVARNQLRVFDGGRDVLVTFEQADVFDFIQKKPAQADLLIAHAFLDLLPMPESLPRLFALLKPTGLAWLTINFDGLTTLEPVIDPALDTKIERLYHQTMNARPTGGDSQAGRHLFGHLRALGAEILAAGASDWVVYPQNGCYPADEAYFLRFILHFFESSLTGQPDLDAKRFEEWLAERRAQIERGELVYIVHQMDFLVAPPLNLG
jgi:SAM-dependent methyltransferase